MIAHRRINGTHSTGPPWLVAVPFRQYNTDILDSTIIMKHKNMVADSIKKDVGSFDELYQRAHVVSF
jgi:hypothetical protein